MSRIGTFIVGAIVGAVVVAPLSVYAFAKLGGIAMATTSSPLPFEKTLAKTALHASMGEAAKQQDPLNADDTNMLAGAHIYVRDCAVCHGVPDGEETAIAKGEFPNPPQLFQPKQMV